MALAHLRKTVVSFAVGLITAVCMAPGCQTNPNAATNSPSTSIPLPPDAVSAATPVRRGTLIIAGGAIADDNQSPWRALVAGCGPDRNVGVLPTASGVPEEAVTNAARAVAELGLDGVQAVEVPIRAGDTASADATDSVRLIDGLGAVWITGGDQSRVVSTLISGQRERPALLALRRLLARGGSIGGSSAGAAVMSRTMLLGGDSESWLRTLLIEQAPEKLRLGPGLGFVDGFIADQHFFERGRFGRLLAACMAGPTKVGVGIGENRFVTVDRQSGRITAGPGHAALLMDCTKATLDGRGISGVQISLLAEGDAVVLSGRSDGAGGPVAFPITPGPRWTPGPQAKLPAAAVPEWPVTSGTAAQPKRLTDKTDAFRKGRLVEALEQLCRGASEVKLDSAEFSITLRTTERTVRLRGESGLMGEPNWGIHQVELDLRIKDR